MVMVMVIVATIPPRLPRLATTNVRPTDIPWRESDRPRVAPEPRRIANSETASALSIERTWTMMMEAYRRLHPHLHYCNECRFVVAFSFGAGYHGVVIAVAVAVAMASSAAAAAASSGGHTTPQFVPRLATFARLLEQSHRPCLNYSFVLVDELILPTREVAVNLGVRVPTRKRVSHRPPSDCHHYHSRTRNTATTWPPFQYCFEGLL